MMGGLLTTSNKLTFASPLTLRPNLHLTRPIHSSLHSSRPAFRFTPHPGRATIASSDFEGTPQMATLPPGVTRSSVPLMIADHVTISDPELIRTLSSRSDLGRPANTKLPLVFRLFFYATKFYYPRDDSWAPALQTDGKCEQPQRRQSTIDSLATGFTQDHINRIEALIKSDNDHRTIGVECAKVVAQVILPLPEGEELPDEVANASFDTLTEITDTFNPIKYLRGRRARLAAENYVRELLPNEKYPGDIVHNLGAAAQGFSTAVQLLQGKLNQEIVPTLSKDPMIKGVIRVPLTTTTLGGIFPETNPLIPDKTLIVMDIGAAAGKTEDASFLFGVGTDHRQCPFKDLFLTSVSEIRNRNVSG